MKHFMGSAISDETKSENPILLNVQKRVGVNGHYEGNENHADTDAYMSRFPQQKGQPFFSFSHMHMTSCRESMIF